MVHFGLLGPLVVVNDKGTTLEVGGSQPRILLAMLRSLPGG
jgi:hypothetical protein